MTTNKNNNGNFTQKQINECAKWYNQEYSNIFGCLRAMLALKDKAPVEIKNALNVLQLKDKKCVDMVAKLVMNNNPVVATDKDGNLIPFEYVTRVKTETKERTKVLQPISRWTFKKVLNTIRVIQGTKEQKNISNN